MQPPNLPALALELLRQTPCTSSPAGEICVGPMSACPPPNRKGADVPFRVHNSRLFTTQGTVAHQFHVICTLRD